jgi:cyclophilin family peptidyl-prolyl cis-trans isomerase
MVAVFWVTATLSLAGAHAAAAEKPEAGAQKPASEQPAANGGPEKKAAEKKAPEKQAPEKKEAKQPKKVAKQPAAKKAAPEKAPAELDAQAVQRAYQQKVDEWRKVLKQLRTLQNEYHTADPAQAADIQRRWEETISQGEQVLQELRPLAIQAYQAAPNEDRQLSRFLVKMLLDEVLLFDKAGTPPRVHARYKQAEELGEILIRNNCDMNDIYAATAMAHFALHDFARAKELFAQARQLNSLPEEAAVLADEVDNYLKYWPEEQQIRQQEAEADNLPRVKLSTNKGDIVLELFEDQAPGTVGNFVSLVQKGFYDGLTFHRVLPGFMAQGGCPEGTGSGGPGYTIYDEFDKPEARKHFRGSLSMAKTGAPNSGGSQFFITYRPTPHLNGKHTVFGRVIEGMEVAKQLQPRDPSAAGEKPEPDKIIKAEVLRKRDHEYLPNKVQ